MVFFGLTLGVHSPRTRALLCQCATFRLPSTLQSLHMVPREQAVSDAGLSSLEFHPHSAVFASADRSGSVTLSSLVVDGDPPSSSASCCQVVARWRPHWQQISCLQFLPGNPHRLLSSSYDGTVCSVDFEHGNFEQVPKAFFYFFYVHLFGIPTNFLHVLQAEDDLCKFLAFQSPHCLLVTLHSGNLVLVDLQESSKRYIAAIWVIPMSSDQMSSPVDEKFGQCSGANFAVWVINAGWPCYLFYQVMFIPDGSHSYEMGIVKKKNSNSSSFCMSCSLLWNSSVAL